MAARPSDEAPASRPRAGRPVLDDPRAHERLLLGLMVALFAYLVLPPLFFIGWSSLSSGPMLRGGGGLSLRVYADIFTSPTLPRLVGDTLVFALGSTVVGTSLGGLMAWLVERTNVPGRQVAYAAVFFGVAVPAMIRVIGWILLLGPHGVLNQLFAPLFGSHGPAANVETMPGMILIEGSFWAPVAFLLLVGPFRGMDAHLEEAAEIAGASPWRTYRSVTLRVLRPSILSILILTFIRTVQAFEVPLFLGVPGGVHILTASIFTEIQESYVPRYGQASAYGILLLMFLSVVLWGYASVTRHASRFHTVTGKAFRSRRVHLGPWRWPAAGFLWLMVVLEGLPGVFMVVASFLRSLGVVGTAPWWRNLTDANYRQLTAFPGIGSSVFNSLVIALLSATAAVGLAVIASWLVARGQVRGRRVIDVLISLPLVFPGVVMSLAMLIMYLRVPLHIYGTIWVFVLAYVATFTPYAMRYTHPALLQIHRELEEVAYVSGAGWLQTFRRILAPLLTPAMVGAWAFIFLISLRELAVASLLYTAHSQVIATQLLDMWTNGNLNVLSAFGTLVSIAGAVVTGVVFRLSRSFGV